RVVRSGGETREAKPVHGLFFQAAALDEGGERAGREPLGAVCGVAHVGDCHGRRDRYSVITSTIPLCHSAFRKSSIIVKRARGPTLSGDCRIPAAISGVPRGAPRLWEASGR